MMAIVLKISFIDKISSLAMDISREELRLALDKGTGEEEPFFTHRF